MVFLKKLAVPAAALVAFAVLAVSSNSGIWDPYEMNRAHVARQIAGQAKVLVVESGTSLRQTLEGSDIDLYIETLEQDRIPEEMVKRAGGSAQRILKKAETRLKSAVYHGVLMDMSVLSENALKGVAFLDSFAQDAPGTPLILAAQTEEECASALNLVEKAMVEEAALALKTNYQLMPTDANVDGIVEERAGAYPFVVGAPCVASDAASLTAALEGVKAERWARVQFKSTPVKGAGTATATAVTQSVPPLDYWLTALSYKVLGFSEVSSRAPFVIMGLLLLLLFALGVRKLFDLDTAALASAILVSIPLFVGQAKNMAGEVSYSLLLTLCVLTFMAMVRSQFSVLRLLPFVAGFLALFLAKGLFGLLVLLLLLLSYVVLARDRRFKEVVLPVSILAVVFGVLTLLVQMPGEWTFFSHFKFMNRTFSGPLRPEMQTFDYFLRQVACVALPWSFILPFAIARLLPNAQDAQADTDDRRLSLLVFLWFCVPFTVHTALLPDFAHTVFPAAASIALAVALMWRQEALEEKVNRFQAVVVVGIAAVVLNSAFESPEHLLSFLTADPHFGGKGGQAFPADYTITTVGKALLGLAFLVMLAYYARGGAIFKTVVRFLRGPKAFWATLWSLAVLLAIRLAAGLGDRYFGALHAPAANKLSPADQAFYWELYYRPESIMLYLSLAVMGVTALLLFTRVGAKAKSALSFAASLGRGIARVFTFATSSFAAPAVSAALAIAGLLDILLTFEFEPGYFRVFLSSPACLALVVLPVVATGASALWARITRSRPGLALSRTGVLAVAVTSTIISVLLLTSVFLRQTDFSSPDIWALTLGSFLAALAWWMPRLSGSPAGYHAAAWGLVVAGYALLVAPMTFHWGAIEAVVYPRTTNPFLPYLFLESRLTWIPVILAAAVVANALVLPASKLIRSLGSCSARLDGMGSWNPALWPEAFDRRPVFLTAALAVAVGFGVYFGVAFLPSFSLEVSQKHILELYHDAESRADIGDDIFKYQQKSGTENEDRNFYTAPVPAIDSQQEFTKVLVNREDIVVSVQRSPSHPGPANVLVRGFSDKNDSNADGLRDFKSDAGLATAFGDNRVEDSTKSWTPDEWKGYKLFDWRGNSVEVTGNDATALFLAATPPMDTARGETLRYLLDNPSAPDHKASAMERQREYVILGQETFSSVNFTFRTSSGGAHIPVLDGSNVNFLLASSFLKEGEKNHNRFAEHTFKMEDIAALAVWSKADPNAKYSDFGVPDELGKFGRLKGGYVNFDDQIKLLGFQMEDVNLGRNEKLRLRMFFEATGKINTSWKIFIHIDSVAASNRINGDHWPLNMSTDPEEKNCVGCWRTNHWMTGDVVLDDYQTDVPLGCPSGTQQIHMGFFTPGSDKRLKVKDFEKGKISHDGSDRVRIGTFEVN